MAKEQDFLDKAGMLKDEIRAQLNQKSIRYRYHDSDVSVLEGVLARGDRKLSKLVEAAYRNGALFDAWTDTFRLEAWQKAARQMDRRGKGERRFKNALYPDRMPALKAGNVMAFPIERIKQGLP